MKLLIQLAGVTIACVAVVVGASNGANTKDMVLLSGGRFTMGNTIATKLESDDLPGQEGVQVESFWMDKYAVTNDAFAKFVADTDYKTDSEKFEWSFVLEYHGTKTALETTEQTIQGAEHWLACPKASWKAPNGPGSSVTSLGNYPVVHISYNDAKAYCKWAKKRLPTETEWEYAARGGLNEQVYPWGKTVIGHSTDPSIPWRANIWQGGFPKEDTKLDGYSGPAPVDAFGPNGFGIYNSVGNVWEWTSTKWNNAPVGQKTLRGGSFLDSIDGSFNHIATVNTRMGNSMDSASSNTGFRCALSASSTDLEQLGESPDFDPEYISKINKDSKFGYSYNRKSSGSKKPTQSNSKAAKEKMANIDQEMLQKLVEEGGVEALQEYLGKTATVTTAGELRKQHEKVKQTLSDLESKDEL